MRLDYVDTGSYMDTRLHRGRRGARAERCTERAIQRPERVKLEVYIEGTAAVASPQHLFSISADFEDFSADLEDLRSHRFRLARPLQVSAA